jgi:hypothetical protein
MERGRPLSDTLFRRLNAQNYTDSANYQPTSGGPSSCAFAQAQFTP